MTTNVTTGSSIRAHINWKLAECGFYLCALREYSEKVFGGIRPLGFDWTVAEHQQKAQTFLYLFSGFLSAFRCVSFYMKKACDDRKPASTWYEEQVERAVRDGSVLAAFCLLRDSDVHHRTLLTSSAVKHSVNLAEGTMTSDFKLNEYDLRTLDMLAKHSWAVKILAGDSVLAVSEAALGELKLVVEQGINAGLF